MRGAENRDDVGLRSNHHSQGGGADSPPQVQDAGPSPVLPHPGAV